MQFKNGFLFVCGGLLALCIVFIVSANTFAVGGSSNSVNLSEYTGTIAADGNGYVYADPDIAMVTVGVVTEGSTSTQAMADNANKMDAVVKTIKGLGVADKDIQTSQVSVQPKYTTTYPGYASANIPVTVTQNISGYTATNTVTVTVRDLSKTGPVVDAAYNSGSNQIQGVTFSLSDDLQSKVYNEALQKAIADGTGKAKTMATAAGVTDYKLKTISESGSYYPVAFNGLSTSGMADKAVAPTTISPGQAKVQASVSLTYVFVPQ